MSILRAGDERFHHQDNSHRWTGGPPPGERGHQEFEDDVRWHKALHLEDQLGVPAEGEGTAR